MSSGFKEIVENLNERIVSADTNRAQKFKGADIAEMQRYAENVLITTDDLEAGSSVIENTTTGTPLGGEIQNGFLVTPAIGTFALTVSPGVGMFIAPDAAADDSNYKYVHDLGVSSGLAIGSNGSGSIRIDVIECQPTAQNAETATRDVYNPLNGTFAPTLVTKAVNMKLTYRVRAGTPGSGYPGAASGWMPLCIASVPTGATSNDTITFWDVRPLVNDRILGRANMLLFQPRYRKSIFKGDNAAAFAGYIDVDYGQRRLGGRIRRGTPGTDGDFLNVTDSANQVGSFSNNSLWYLWLVEPFRLPRWARYTDSASGARVPRSPRGIPIVTATAPRPAGVTSPIGIIQLPTSTGLGTITTGNFNGCCVASGYVDGAGGLYCPNGDDSKHYLSVQNSVTPSGASTPIVITGTVTSGVATYTLASGTHFPPMAKSVLVEVNVTYSAGSSATIGIPYYTLTAPGAAIFFTGFVPYSNTLSIPSGTSVSIATQIELPVPSNYPATTAFNMVVTFTYGVYSGVSYSGARMRILGWKI